MQWSFSKLALFTLFYYFTKYGNFSTHCDIFICKVIKGERSDLCQVSPKTSVDSTALNAYENSKFDICPVRICVDIHHDLPNVNHYLLRSEMNHAYIFKKNSFFFWIILHLISEHQY